MFLCSSSSLFLFSCGACWKVEVWKVKVKVRQIRAGTFLFDFFCICRQYADGRSAVIQDPGLIRNAVNLSSQACPVLMAGPLGLQERWLAAQLDGADVRIRFCWSDDEKFHRRGVYWLFLTGEHEPPVGVFLILATLLPDDPNTRYSVPCVHNTVGQDLSPTISQKVVRSSYYDRGHKTWPPSTGLYGRMGHPPSSIRQPMLAGSDRLFPSFCLYLCFLWVCWKVEVRKVNVKVRQVCL